MRIFQIGYVFFSYVCLYLISFQDFKLVTLIAKNLNLYEEPKQQDTTLNASPKLNKPASASAGNNNNSTNETALRKKQQVCFLDKHHCNRV